MERGRLNEQREMQYHMMQKRWLKRRLILWAIICIAFFMWAGVQIVEQAADIADKRQDYEATKQRLKQLESEKKELETLAKNLQNPDYIAEIARKEYYMTKPGEVIIIDKHP